MDFLIIPSSIEHGGTKTFSFLMATLTPPECIFIALLTPN